MKINDKGILVWIAISTAAGILNSVISVFLINPHTVIADVTVLNTLGGFVGTLVALVYTFLLVETGGEWKAARDAKDVDTFVIETKKRMPNSFWYAMGVVTFFLFVVYHLFHYESLIVLIPTHFILGFSIALLIQILVDLDDPATGVINVNVPQEWLEALKNEKNS